jgi:hypothetical protein
VNVTLEHDQKLEHLQRTVNTLGNALKTVDRDVEKAAAKYLRSTAPHGHLKFYQFLDLLALEMRREVRIEMADDLKKSKVRAQVLSDAVNQQIEARVTEMLPVLRAKVSEFIKLKVLILVKPDQKVTFRRGETPLLYKAVALRGTARQGLGYKPEDAYERLRENIVLDLAQANTTELVAKYLLVWHGNFFGPFEEGIPWRTDQIGDFQIDVRMERKDEKLV